MFDSQYLGTPHFPWKVLRAATPEDGAAAAVITTGFNFHQKKADCIDLYSLFGDSFSSILVCLYGADYLAETCDDNDTFAFDLIGYRSVLDGLYANSNVGINPPLIICSAATAAAKVGAFRVSDDGGSTNIGRFCDDATLTNDEWPNGIDKFVNGNDYMLMLRFDSNGIRFILPYVWDALGAQAGECPAVGMLISTF